MFTEIPVSTPSSVVSPPWSPPSLTTDFYAREAERRRAHVALLDALRPQRDRSRARNPVYHQTLLDLVRFVEIGRAHV